MATNEDIENLLISWHNAKEEMAELNKKCDRYKKLAEKIMASKDVTSLSSSSFKVSQRNSSITTMAKKDVPSEVWNKYSKKTEFKAYYLSKVRG